MSTELLEVLRLVKIILNRGYSITVNDGEDDVVSKSKNLLEIRSALYSTDEDYLYVYKDDQKHHIGCIYLVYGNAKDGSEVVCDHSTTPAIKSIMEIFDSGLN